VAIRAFIEDWHAAFARVAAELEEVVDIGGGVQFVVWTLTAATPGSSAELRLRFASLTTIVGGLLVNIRNYSDVDEARAAAERLAQERADG
jgi:hypothetical protein